MLTVFHELSWKVVMGFQGPQLLGKADPISLGAFD
jgi:hypothetical protein